MAFFADDNGICRDKWPGVLGDPLVPTERADKLDSWRLLPTSYDELCDRAVVEVFARNSHRVLMAHRDLDGMSEGLSFTVRLQGVVGDINLKALGTWNGDELKAPKATQFLTLVAGGCDDAFLPQRQGVMNLEELVLNMVDQPFTNETGKKGAIRLTRRVFKKTSPNDGAVSIQLGARDDPGGRAAKMKHMWQVEHKIRTGVRKEDNSIAPVSPMAIRRGDFVDVAATVEVVTMRSKKGWRTEVHLCPVDVVRLHTSTVTTALLAPKPAPTKLAPLTKSRLTEVTGIEFNALQVAQVADDQMDISAETD